MRLSVGDKCPGGVPDKAVEGAMRALMGTVSKREEIFRILDTGLCLFVVSNFFSE